MEKESELDLFRQDGSQFFELNCCASFLYQEAFVLGCDKAGKQRNCIQVCQRAELLQTKGCWLVRFPPAALIFSQVVLDRFGWLCTARFKKLVFSVSRFGVGRKEVILSGQLIWLDSSCPSRFCISCRTLYSAQGNAIYNLLPDIISRLSDPDCGVEEESFHIIMRYAGVKEISFDQDYVYAKRMSDPGKRNYSDILS